jgi:hypothetical protein
MGAYAKIAILSTQFGDGFKSKKPSHATVPLSALRTTDNFLKLCSVNVPDPDVRRLDEQYPGSAPRFLTTLVLFSTFCILYR